MTEAGWSTRVPQQRGLYHMRKSGENEGWMIEVEPPNKYRLTTASVQHNLPNDGYEYKAVDAGPASSA